MTTLTPDQVEFCDRQREPEDPGDVTFCDRSENKDPEDVTFCDEGCPDDPVQLVISGSETPSDGAIYTVSGGTGPYTWSIGKGNITRSGPTAQISISGECGSTTITVTDKCGNSGTKDVRLPTGTWVLISDEDFTGEGCGDWEWSPDQIHELTCYSGKYKYWEYTQKHSGPDCACFSHSCPTKICTSSECCLTLWQRKTYEWQCP